MKPAGPERNIEIAKLMGFTISERFYKEENRIRIYCGKLLPIEINGKVFSGYKRNKWFCLPPYSTDRNAAWELFDELPIEFKMRIVAKWSEYKYQSGQFANIVSDVWIPWKEGKKCD